MNTTPDTMEGKIKSALDSMKSESDVPYNEVDHSHCWSSEKPPCGQKIEHLKCCLCEVVNPKVASAVSLAIKKRDEEVVEKVRSFTADTVLGVTSVAHYKQESPDYVRGAGDQRYQDHRKVREALEEIIQFLIPKE